MEQFDKLMYRYIYRAAGIWNITQQIITYVQPARVITLGL